LSEGHNPQPSSRIFIYSGEAVFDGKKSRFAFSINRIAFDTRRKRVISIGDAERPSKAPGS
jgi:hypothetical protein